MTFSPAVGADYLVLRWRSTEPGFARGRRRFQIPAG